MREFSSILSFLKVDLSKVEFLDNYAKTDLQYQDDEEASIFANESAAGQVFDMIDLNKDGKIDKDELNALAALDETDGENKLSEADMKALYKKMADELPQKLEISTPEEMYSQNVTSGKMSSGNYIGTLFVQISLLENLIKQRELSGKNIIDDLQSQLDQLMKSKKGDIKKQYQNKVKERDKLQQGLQNIDIQIRTQSSDCRIQEQIELDKAEISILDPEKDADKIKSYQNKISKLNDRLSEKNATVKNLQNQRSSISTQLDSVNSQISRLVAKATENDKKLQQQAADLNKKIVQEKQSLETDVKNYQTQIDALKLSKEYATDKLIEDFGKNYVNENYEDEDTSNFSYDSAALKQKWSKKAPWLSDGFYNKSTEVAKRVGCDPDVLLAIMDSESGLKAETQNKAGGASGLIQFMPRTARSLGTTTNEIRKMSAEQQLNLVEKCLLSNKKMAGFKADDKLDAGTMYALVFLPAYAKREVLTMRGHRFYEQNKGLDTDGDNFITKRDLGIRIRERIPKG